LQLLAALPSDVMGQWHFPQLRRFGFSRRFKDLLKPLAKGGKIGLHKDLVKTAGRTLAKRSGCREFFAQLLQARGHTFFHGPQAIGIGGCVGVLITDRFAWEFTSNCGHRSNESETIQSFWIPFP